MDRPALVPDNGADLPQRLLLGGYVAVGSSGLALPCYGVSRLPNQWYVAVCSPSGDPEGRIVAFEPTELSGVTVLDDAAMLDVGLGDPWLDVFLWDGVAHVGTRGQLWAALAPLRADIARRAPLTAVDLAFAADDPHEPRRLVRAGGDYLTKAYGGAHAREWRRQVARTRLQMRLQQAGIPERPRSVEVVGEGAAAGLKIDAPAWSQLPEAVQDVLLRAANATADELGLRMRSPRWFRASRVERALSARDGLLREPPPPPEPPSHHDAVALSTLILTFGPRAAKIGRAAKAPEWAPAWSETGIHQAGAIARGSGSQRSWLPWIEVRDFAGEADARGYGVVAVLADDEVLESDEARDSALRRARDLVAPGGIVIIAPALPEDRPSRALLPGHEHLEPAADLLLDTSLARSPNWGTAERLSLDRRIADLVIATAQACLPGSRIHAQIRRRTADRSAPCLATLAIWDRLELSPSYDGGSAFLSEANVPDRRQTWLDEEIPLEGRRRRAPAARLIVGALTPDFAEYAAAVMLRYQAMRAWPGGDAWELPLAPPTEVRDALTRPDLAVGSRIRGSLSPDVALVAETPTLDALEAAERQGWRMTRLTDESGVRRLFRAVEEEVPAPIPTEVALPRLRRFDANRRLATRGADTRDVVRFSVHSPSSDMLGEHPPLLHGSRIWLPAPSERPKGFSDQVLPVQLLQSLAETVPQAARLLSRHRTRGVTGRRLADLAILWRREDVRRFVIEDGRLPPNVLETRGPGEVPAQAWFAIEGDEAVPLLLGSCLFAVWARMTRSRGAGWTQRFAVSRTFETFPILAPFETVESRSGAVALVMHHGGRLRDLAGGLVQSVETSRSSDRGSPERRLRTAADAELLRIYGLPDDAGELDIARRLVELNQTISDEGPSPAPPSAA